MEKIKCEFVSAIKNTVKEATDITPDKPFNKCPIAKNFRELL